MSDDYNACRDCMNSEHCSAWAVYPEDCAGYKQRASDVDNLRAFLTNFIAVKAICELPDGLDDTSGT